MLAWCASIPYPKSDESGLHSPTVFNISFYPPHIRLGLPSCPAQSRLTSSICATYTANHSTLLDHPHNIWRNVKIINLITPFSPKYRYFPSRGTNYSTTNFVLKQRHKLRSSFCATQQIQQPFAEGKSELCNRPFKEQTLADCSERESRAH
jgi:hypothetical protein